MIQTLRNGRTNTWMGTTTIPSFILDRAMRWIYRLQQRIAITRIESNIISCFALLCAIGFTARYVQSSPHSLPDTVYTETMQRFEQASTTAADEVSLPSPAVAVDMILTDTLDRTRTADRTPRARKKALPVTRMNLNTASASQLQRLPRIGPKMAERILAYRSEYGDFKRVSDLQNVRGIGKKTLAQLEPYLFVENES